MAGPMMGLVEEAVLPETLGLALTDPTTILTGAVLLEEGGLVVVVVAEVGAASKAAATMVAMAMQPPMIKVPRKATWEGTITTVRARHKGSTTRTATTTMRQVRDSTIQSPLAVTIRASVMKVRLRVTFELLRSEQRARVVPRRFGSQSS